MSELILHQFMYPERHKRDTLKAGSKSSVAVRYSLIPPAPWLTAIGAVMWEGILQGLAWDVVKAAVGRAVETLRGAGLAPAREVSHDSARTLSLGWREYSEPGANQYEMFLTLKKSYRQMPNGHAVAYARAKSDKNFGDIIRAERQKFTSPDKSPPRPTKKTSARWAVQSQSSKVSKPRKAVRNRIT